MAPPQALDTRSPRPGLSSRAALFGSLLLGFAMMLILAGRHAAQTTNSRLTEKHPCVLVTPETAEGVRARLDRDPYHGWYDRLLEQCRQNPRPTVGDQNGLLAASRVAEAQATAFVLTGNAHYARAACTNLARLRAPSRGGRWQGAEEIREGAASVAVAYDCLFTYLRRTGSVALDRKTRDLIYELGADLLGRRRAGAGLDTDTGKAQNFATAGLCALVVSDYEAPGDSPSPHEVYSRARAGLTNILKRQICRDGAWAEGPGAYQDAAKSFLPFIIANQRLTGENLMDEPGLRAMEWTARLRMPDGQRPNIEGSPYTPSLTFALAPLCTEVPGFLAWDARTEGAAEMMPTDLLPEAICWHNDQGETGVPDDVPSQTLEVSGDVVFRSDWGPDAAYMLVRAERGRALDGGGPLAQPDATSMMIAQGREVLAMDTGFGGWSHLRETARAGAHSMVVEDVSRGALRPILGGGAGAQTATTSEILLGKDVSAARIRREETGGVYDRVVVFAEGDIIVFDHAAAARAKGFTWLLHTNAGDGTGGSVRAVANMARIARPTATMQIVLTSPASEQPSFELRTARHFPQIGEVRTHEVLEATVREGQSAAFLSVLSPRPAGKRSPTVTREAGDGWLAVSIDGQRHAIFSTSGAANLGTRQASTDGYGLWWSEDASGQVTRALALGATRISVGGRTVSGAKDRQTLAWRRGGNG